MEAPATEQGLPGDMAVGPSELSSGRGGRSTGTADTHTAGQGFPQTLPSLVISPAPPGLTHVVHDGGLRRLAVQVDHSVDVRGYVPGRRALRHAVHEEMQAAVFLPDNSDRVPSLQAEGPTFYQLEHNLTERRPI